MPTKLYLGKYKTISAKTIQKRYSLERHELYKLILENKLKLLPISCLLFSETAVLNYFDNKNKRNASPVTISSQDVIAKFNLDRVEFKKLIDDGLLKPLPITEESNWHFGFKATCAFFANRNK